jgi:hypothetical protein
MSDQLPEAAMRTLSIVLLLLAVGGAQPPAMLDIPPEPAKLSEEIEQAVRWYDLLPEDGAAPLPPVTVIRWRNVARGQEGEAMMVVWPQNGRPIAMASIYPWAGYMVHEFDSLSRGHKLTAREQGRVIWSPATAGVEFHPLSDAAKPATSPAERVRQMKAIAERFKATMTGWSADNSDREELRLLPRPLYRYDLTAEKAPELPLLDGGLFAYVQGTDPEVVLIIEAIGTADKADWQYAFVRATSGGVEAKLGDRVVWTAPKGPVNRDPNLPHFSIRRPLK